MWKDFVEGWGFRFERKEKFPKFYMFVSEMKTWIEWHEKETEHRVKRTAILFVFLGIGFGIVIGSWLVIMSQFYMR